MGPCISIKSGAKYPIGVGMGKGLEDVYSMIAHVLSVVEFQGLGDLGA